MLNIPNIFKISLKNIEFILTILMIVFRKKSVTLTMQKLKVTVKNFEVSFSNFLTMTMRKLSIIFVAMVTNKAS
jgi:hypothetical protein